MASARMARASSIAGCPGKREWDGEQFGDETAEELSPRAESIDDMQVIAQHRPPPTRAALDIREMGGGECRCESRRKYSACGNRLPDHGAR